MLETTRTGPAGARPPGRHPLTPAAGAPGGSIGRWRRRRSQAHRVRSGSSGSCRPWRRCTATPAATCDGDATAGLAVWAAAVPSGLAYAGLAGLPPIVGLYASAVAGLAYGLAGTIRQAQVGPTSTSSILTAAAIAPMAHGDVARATALAARARARGRGDPAPAPGRCGWASSPTCSRGRCSSASPRRSRW